MPQLRSIIFLAASIGLSAQLSAQDQDSVAQSKQYQELAELALEANLAADDARDQMEIAANYDPNNLKANFMAGELRLKTIGKSLAVKYFMRVYERDPSYNFALEYYIGRGYQYGEQFDKAIDFYTRYQNKLKSKPNYQGKDRVAPADVERRIYECQNGKEYTSNPGKFSIVNIGNEINSEFDDYSPVLNEDEDEIVFTSRRKDDNLNQDVADDNKPYEDIFIATKSGNRWTRAKNIGNQINTPYNGSNLALTPDGNTLYFYSDENGGDVYASERINGQWMPPEPLPGIINSSYEENSASITKDEKTLYFSSRRPGGYGELDIYKATKNEKGEWSNVKNLGPKINGPLDDTSPFIDYDQTTLYFSTDGRKGMGGYDIFKSTLTVKGSAEEWSEPENMGYPINTPDDDVFYVRSKDGERAYYSSVREDGLGYTDIYIITEPEPTLAATKKPEVPKVDPPKKDTVVVANVTEPVKEPVVITEPVKEPVVVKEPVKEPIKEPVKEPAKQVLPSTFTVKVADALTNEALDAKISLKGLRDNVIVPMNSNGPGEYSFKISTAQTKDYRLAVEVEGYSFQNINVKLDGASANPKSVSRTVNMRKLQVGSVSILRNIYFDFDKATFTTEAYPELNKLLNMMQQNTNLNVEIGGHTDYYGSKEVNMRLSTRRAEAVKDYLVKKGVDSRRITAVGYGKSRPLASNDDEEEGRELNRRVEFKVLKN